MTGFFFVRMNDITNWTSTMKEEGENFEKKTAHYRARACSTNVTYALTTHKRRSYHANIKLQMWHAYSFLVFHDL